MLVNVGLIPMHLASGWHTLRIDSPVCIGPAKTSTQVSRPERPKRLSRLGGAAFMMERVLQLLDSWVDGASENLWCGYGIGGVAALLSRLTCGSDLCSG